MVKQPKQKKIVRKQRPVQVKEKKVINFRGLHCDSLAETYCLMWLFELEERGYIVKGSVKRAPTYILFNTVPRNYVFPLKTKNITKMEILYNACQYTPDFECQLTPRGRKLSLFKDINYEGKLRERGKAFLVHQDGRVTIEVKGSKSFDDNASEEKWSVVNKWLWSKEGVFCNLWTADIFMALTFTAREYMLTPKTKQPRKIKWKVVDIETYLKTISK